MNVAAKKPFTPAPRMNILKDQLKEQRFGLITKVKALREQRQALKGVKGSGQKWGELCAQIDEVQAKIDLLSKSLGLPVKDRKEAMSGNVKPFAGKHVIRDTSNPDLGRAVMDARDGKTKALTIVTDEFGNLPDVAVGSYLTPTKPAPMFVGNQDRGQNHQHGESLMVMTKEDTDAWDDFQAVSDIDGNK